MALKNSLKVERARLDMTQQDLADKLLISRQTVHFIEKEKKVPSLILGLKIANLFKKPVEEIFHLETHKKE